MRACASALSALGHTTPALDTDSQLIEELAPRGLVRYVLFMLLHAQTVTGTQIHRQSTDRRTRSWGAREVSMRVRVCVCAFVCVCVCNLSTHTNAHRLERVMYSDLSSASDVCVCVCVCHHRPVQPQSPKVLPSIAALWPFLIQSLSDPRTPLVEEALTLLAEVIREGGGAFMARR